MLRQDCIGCNKKTRVYCPFTGKLCSVSKIVPPIEHSNVEALLKITKFGSSPWLAIQEIKTKKTQTNTSPLIICITVFAIVFPICIMLIMCMMGASYSR